MLAPPEFPRTILDIPPHARWAARAIEQDRAYRRAAAARLDRRIGRTIGMGLIGVGIGSLTCSAGDACGPGCSVDRHTVAACALSRDRATPGLLTRICRLGRSINEPGKA